MVRRLIAIGLALGALHVTLSVVRDPARGVPVVVATQTVPAGQIIESSDLEVREVPAAALPDAALADPADLVGRPASVGISPGETLTADRVVGPDSTALASLRRGVTVPLVAVAPGVGAGDRVDLHLPGARDPVASDVLVIAAPASVDLSEAVAPQLTVAATARDVAGLSAAMGNTDGVGFLVVTRPRGPD